MTDTCALPADLRATVTANLARFDRRGAHPDAVARSAAVSLCVVDVAPVPYLVMIKRVPRGRNAGQWALPGGRVEPGEDPVAAALRELGEEVGLQVEPDEVVGLLDDFVTDSGFRITPVVVITSAAQALRRNPDEVHSVHRIPLARLLHSDLPRWRRAPDGSPLLQMPLRRTMVVHAPTGAILWQFREVALRGNPLRVDHVAQPAFTRG
jgi:8-oxo-dGTP pyrophosphatase MutT (NUDIX family)